MYLKSYRPNTRTNAATFLRKEFGLETARIILGHRSAAITKVYAELDQQKALEAIVRGGSAINRHKIYDFHMYSIPDWVAHLGLHKPPSQY